MRLVAQDVENPLDPALAEGGKPPQVWPSDANRACAERQRFDDIGAPAEAAVDQHRHSAADRLDDLRQGIDRCSAVVTEPSAMIRHNDRIDPGFGREHGVLLRQNPLEQELSFHAVAQPVHKDPIHVGAIETLDGGQVEAGEIRSVREEIPEGATVAIGTLACIDASHPGQGFPIAVNDRIDRQNDGGGPGRLRTPDQRFGHLPPIDKTTPLHIVVHSGLEGPTATLGHDLSF